MMSSFIEFDLNMKRNEHLVENENSGLCGHLDLYFRVTRAIVISRMNICLIRITAKIYMLSNWLTISFIVMKEHMLRIRMIGVRITQPSRNRLMIFTI